VGHLGVWASPPCVFCSVPIQPTADHTACPQFLGLPGLWADSKCWVMNRADWHRWGVSMLGQMKMDLQGVA
jgi:hypothetical protein